VVSRPGVGLTPGAGPPPSSTRGVAAAAAITTRVRIVPTLYLLPVHSAIKVAKHAATFHLISGGRITITVGVGGHVHDYRCMEKELVRRYARMDEQVAQIRSIWAGEEILRANLEQLTAALEDLETFEARAG
jgi:alkanesulfonate monooxygenase SsuD/methylene tetrahydromethanopterin reductase-like flavin-dependent oxidoreductase (luciferase family)